MSKQKGEIGPSDARVRLNIGLVIAFAIGFLAFYVLPKQVYSQVYYGAASPKWPQAEALITKSDMIASPTTRGLYEPHISYQYTVDGISYEGNRHRWNLNTGNPTEIKGILSGYGVNQSIPIYYEPRNPQNSVIEPGITTGEVLEASIAAILGEIVILFFLICVLFDINKMRKKL